MMMKMTECKPSFVVKKEMEDQEETRLLLSAATVLRPPLSFHPASSAPNLCCTPVKYAFDDRHRQPLDVTPKRPILAQKIQRRPAAGTGSTDSGEEDGDGSHSHTNSTGATNTPNPSPGAQTVSVPPPVNRMSLLQIRKVYDKGQSDMKNDQCVMPLPPIGTRGLPDNNRSPQPFGIYKFPRGPDDLHRSPLSNGGLAATAMTVDQEATKKVRLENGSAVASATAVTGNVHQAAVMAAALTAPMLHTQHVHVPRSKVVHLRNIPNDMTDMELIHMCIPFGKLTNFLLLKGKNQAFVEYDDEQSAMQLIAVSQACPIQLRGRTIFCQFSNHQELKTDNKAAFNTHPNAGMMPGAGQQQQQVVGVAGVNMMQQQQTVPAPMTPTSVGNELMVNCVQHQPNSVLRVIIENMLYPVTLDVLHSIFSRFGKVLRIITFSKNNTFQALIQLSEANAALLAKQALDAQNVYTGCCTLRIDFSKLATLNVKYNNDKSRDYTNPNLPAGELTLEQQLGLATGALTGLSGSQNAVASLAALQNPSMAAMLAASQSAALQANPLMAYTQAASLQQSQLQSALNACAAQTQSSSGLQMPSAFNFNASTGQPHSPATLATLRAMPQLGLLALSPVVLVSNLNEEKVTPDALFTLFGVYGDVQRVKILFNKKDNALIQFAEPAQAQLAIQHIDKAKLWARQIRVAASKHNNVQMPKEGQPDAGLTKDYSQSPLHRFKKPGSKNYMNIYPPSSTLHLSNIPPNITEAFLIEAYRERGFHPQAFKFFPKDHKMALMQMLTVDEATEALIELHNYKLADNAHLRVSFSKSGI